MGWHHRHFVMVSPSNHDMSTSPFDGLRVTCFFLCRPVTSVATDVA